MQRSVRLQDLSADEFALVEEQTLALLGPDLAGAAERYGIDIGDGIRFGVLSEQIALKAHRTRLVGEGCCSGHQSSAVRIRAIESGHLSQIDPEVLERYLKLLELRPQARRWAAQNPAVAAKVGLA